MTDRKRLSKAFGIFGTFGNSGSTAMGRLTAAAGSRDLHLLDQSSISGWHTISDAGMVNLAGLLRLETLVLGWTNVGDAGLYHLLT